MEARLTLLACYYDRAAPLGKRPLFQGRTGRCPIVSVPRGLGVIRSDSREAAALSSPAVPEHELPASPQSPAEGDADLLSVAMGKTNNFRSRSFQNKRKLHRIA